MIKTEYLRLLRSSFEMNVYLRRYKKLSKIKLNICTATLEYQLESYIRGISYNLSSRYISERSVNDEHAVGFKI